MSLGVGSLVSVGGGSASSGSGGSGILVINPGNNTGPTVEFHGANGISVTSPSTNVILIDGVALSGVSKFATSFTGVSGLITHGLNTLDVIVSVYDRSSGGAKQILPDQIIVENLGQVSVLFNTPISNARVVIV